MFWKDLLPLLQKTCKLPSVWLETLEKHCQTQCFARISYRLSGRLPRAWWLAWPAKPKNHRMPLTCQPKSQAAKKGSRSWYCPYLSCRKNRCSSSLSYRSNSLICAMPRQKSHLPHPQVLGKRPPPTEATATSSPSASAPPEKPIRRRVRSGALAAKKPASKTGRAAAKPKASKTACKTKGKPTEWLVAALRGALAACIQLFQACLWQLCRLTLAMSACWALIRVNVWLARAALEDLEAAYALRMANDALMKATEALNAERGQ